MTLALFSLIFFLFYSRSFSFLFLSSAPSSILLQSFSSASATRGFGSSFAHLMVMISPPSNAWLVMHSLANSAMHLCLYFTNAQPLWGRILTSSTSPQSVKCLRIISYSWVTPLSLLGSLQSLTQIARVSLANEPTPFISSLKELNLALPKISLFWSMVSHSSMLGTLWQNLQLTPFAQHPLAKNRQKKAACLSLNRSAAVQPVSSSGSQRVRAASFSFSSLAQMYLLYQKLYSSSPSLQVQLLAKLVSTCLRAGRS